MKDIYCELIIPGKLDVDIVYETELVMAFHHTAPYFEEHIVIIPKTHIESLARYTGSAELSKDLFEAICFVTKMLEEKHGACRVSSNIGEYQSSKHLHWYVHYGRRIRRENE